MEILYKVLILVGLFIVGYIFGSIPNGVIISKVFYGVDPREGGSKNTGGTNVGRVVSKKAGILTVACDVLKVLIPFMTTFLVFTYVKPVKDFMLGADQSYNIYGQGNTLVELSYYLVALGGMIGHAYSIFLKFKGGKVVSTFCGYALGITWTSCPIFLPIFFITLKFKKYVSVSSLTMCGAFTLFTWILYIIYAFCGKEVSGWLMLGPSGPLASIYLPVVSTLCYLLIIYKHKSNIINLINHTEKTAGWNKKAN